MNSNEIVLYRSRDGKTNLDVKFDQETVWLNQKQLTKLFKTSKQNLSLHINNIFKEKELIEDSVVKEYLTTAADGKSYATKYYNLDVIISVGYRVKSKEGTLFRVWATNVLRQHILSGYTANIKRLRELEEKHEALRNAHDLLRHTVNKFLLTTARRDVVNAIVDEVEALKQKISKFKEENE